MAERLVKISSNKQRNGRKRHYYLRWFDADEGRIVSEPVGTDRRKAESERVKKEDQLLDGSYQRVRRATWDQLIADYLGGISGDRHRAEAKRTTDEFVAACKVDPQQVTYAVLRDFRRYLHAKRQNSAATINKKFRYLRSLFYEAIAQGYMNRHPMPSRVNGARGKRWSWEAQDEKDVREITRDEQRQLERAAMCLFGFRWKVFVRCALNIGARRSELLRIAWADVDFDRGEVVMRKTKTHRARRVPFNADVAAMLERLKRGAGCSMPLAPFIGMDDDTNRLGREWEKIRSKAQTTDVRIQDCRCTYITRLLRAGVPTVTVAKLAGNSLKVIERYYAAVNLDDRREAVAKLAVQALCKRAAI